MSATPDSSRPLLVFGDDGRRPADIAWRWITNQPWPEWYLDVLTADETDTEIEWGAPPRVTEWTPGWGRSEGVGGARSVRFLKVATDPRAMLAEREDADLVVLGLSTHSFLEGLVTGSTTEWLLHHPPAPMVVAISPEEVHKVTVCADGSSHALAALEAFVSLPLAEESLVTVLAIADGRTDAEGAVAAAIGVAEGRVAELVSTVREGRPTATILEHLEEHMPDMVVLGTRGLTGWQRLRLGSTASAVVRSAPCTSLIASTDTR